MILALVVLALLEASFLYMAMPYHAIATSCMYIGTAILATATNTGQYK